VKEVMTQINYVFTVCEDSIIDYDFMQKITDAGYSRIPVRKKEPNGTGDIIGLLFLRDLVMVDPDDRIEVSTVTNYYKHQLKKIDEDTKLDDMLEIFKNGAYHLSLVTRQIEIGGGKKEIEEVGIITLEDIIEEIICDEIVDETDKYINNKTREKNSKREKMDPEFNNILRNAQNSQTGNPNNPDNLEEVSRNQIAALHRFLVAEIEPFAPHKVSENQLRNILNRQESLVYVKRNDDTKPLYEKGKPMTCFIVIIEGKAEVRFGHEAEMPIEVGPFRCFGIAAMDVKTTHFGGILPKPNKG
jgi:metal transporter CNNM